MRLTIDVFIMTSAQLLHNGTMKHEAMPDHALYDVKLPKSYSIVNSDSVISVFSYTTRFTLFYDLATLFD